MSDDQTIPCNEARLSELIDYAQAGSEHDFNPAIAPGELLWLVDQAHKQARGEAAIKKSLGRHRFNASSDARAVWPSPWVMAMRAVTRDKASWVSTLKVAGANV